MSAQRRFEPKEVPRLELTRAQFRALASGYGDPDAIAVLNAGQRTRRRLLIRAVAEEADRRGLRQTARLDAALRLLVAAWHRSAEAVEPVLSHPYLAAWARQCLRLMAEPDRSAEVVVDVGQLHAVAAAAAVRARLDFKATIPTRDGLVSLPALGAVHGLGEGPVRIESDRDGMLVTGVTGRWRVTHPLRNEVPGWAPRRQLTLDGLTLAVEDTDSYRGCYPWRPTRRLPEAEFERVSGVLAGAWQLIRDEHPRHARAMAAGLRSVVPVEGPTASSAVSAASRFAYGSVALAVPDEPAAAALLLIHEFQHMKLGGLLDLVRLHTADGTPRHFAPWRADARPLEPLLQGIYAHLGVADFWRVHRLQVEGRQQRLAEFEFAYWLAQTSRAAEHIAECGELNRDGREFVALLADTLRKWATEPGPDDIGRGVRTLVDAAALRWRLANLDPTESDLRQLYDAWRSGTGPPTPGPADGASVCPAPSAPAVPSGLAGRLRELLIEPAGGPDRLPEPGGAYLDGRFDAAVSGYADLIRQGADDAETWTGLALSMAAAGSAGAATMKAAPERVRALYRTLRDPDRPDPGRLAAWFTGEAVHDRAGGPAATA